MRKTRISLEKHIKNANDMAAACHYLTKIANRCGKYYPETSKVMKLIKILSPVEENSLFIQLQEALTAKYHTTVKRKDLKPEEEIYKNLNERYKKLRG